MREQKISLKVKNNDHESQIISPLKDLLMLPSKETNVHIPLKLTFEDDFPFPKVGYVSSLEGK